MPADLRSWRRLTYTLWAPVYDLLAWPLGGARRRALRRLDLRPGERVLLIGAGTGLDLPWLPTGVDVIAVDLAPAMLRRLQRRATRSRRVVYAAVMDAEQLALPDACVDAVVMHLILSVVPDASRCAAEAARVLRPGGRVVVLDKFIGDSARPSVWRRLAQPIFNFFGTNITRRLGPIIAHTDLQLDVVESAGRSGYLQIARLTKPAIVTDGDR